MYGRISWNWAAVEKPPENLFSLSQHSKFESVTFSEIQWKFTDLNLELIILLL